MACFNRNTQEYKDLLGAFSSNMQVDGIITAWQNVNNSKAFPTVGQAKQFLKDKKIAFSLQQRNFAEAILGNLSKKNLISKFKDEYYVVKSNAEGVNKQILQSNLNKIKRYLDINNIPQDAVKFEITTNSVRISINENIFTPKDIIQSSRGWDETRSRHIVTHLMRIFPNIKLSLISVAEAQAYYDDLPASQKANMPFEKVKSYFDPVAGQVVLIKGRVTDETAIEEMLHPFTDALFVDNKALFDSLLSEAKTMFPVLNQQIEDAYSEKNGFNQKDRDFELVTQALTRHFKKEYEENPTKTFKERVKEFLQWFANIINNLHKYITGKDINQVQTLVNETAKFKTTIIQDNKSYYRGQIEKPIIDKDGNLVLYAKEDELYKKAGLKSKGVSMTDDLQSAIEYGNGQLEVAQNLASETYDANEELEKLSENGYYLIQIPKNISNEIVKEAGEVKVIGDKIIIPKGQYKIEQVIDGVETQTIPQQAQQSVIKPGVAELFESNPELANAVYEAAGFEIPTAKLQGRKAVEGKLVNFDVIEEIASGKRSNLPSSILIKKLLEGGYLPKINETDIVLGGLEYGIWRSNLKKIEAQGQNNSNLAKKIGHELLHSVTHNIIYSYQNLKGIVDFNDKYYKDFIRQGYIEPVDLTKSQIEALDNLVRIRNKVVAYVEQNKDKIQKEDRGFGTYDYFIRTNYTESETDLHEFISEVFTNPELINILKEIPTEGKKSNLFKDFVDAVAKILGFTNTSILEDVIAYSEEAFFAQPQITPQQKQQAQQLYSQYIEQTGKQDIEGFKEFVSKPTQTSSQVVKINLQDINPNATLSDIAKLLNTSDIKFDLTAIPDPKIRFSLTPELQSTVDYAVRQSNAIQAEIINRLFYQAQTTKEKVSSLTAGFEGPIVVLNEENHVYYNLLDTNETFNSTTERIKGKLSEEDMFNKKLNIDLGNDFDKLLQGLTSDKKLDEVFSQMKVLNREQAEKAYLQLQENLREITRGGGVAVPQVVVYDQKSKTAGSIDILIILPDGKLRIVDLKTSKNSVKDMVLNEQSKLKYDKEYELGPDSDLKKAGIESLSTRAQQGIQVNIYRRMLENMGYEVDMSEMGASTFHVQVGIKGKDAQQEFTGEFKSDDWVLHPASQNSLYVDLLVPKNVDLILLETLKKNIDDAVDNAVDWDLELKDNEKIPENIEFSDPYIEYEVITQALENYRLALITKLKAIDQIKSSIYMDRTKEQTEENILNALSAISMAIAEGPKASSALFTELLRDALKQIQSFTDYISDPNNFNKSEYITYVLNFNRFIKTFEGLYSVKDLTGINATQKSLILRLQTQLNNLGVSNLTQDGIINDAITNYVKTQIKNWSSRDDLTDDVLNDLMKHARDIDYLELSTSDLSTSRDTILAVMDKIYKVKKQELLDRIETRNRVIASLSSRLQKLSPNKNTQDLYNFMLEFDDNGEFTGRYVQRLGKQYYKKQQDLRDKLYDENGNPLEYRDVSDAATAKKEDLEFNINLAKLKAAYAAFWSAERLTLEDKLVDGEFHKYTDEFKAIRAKYQYYASVNGKPVWRRKAGVSDKAYQIYLAKYFDQVEYTYAKKDQNGNFTGSIVRESVFNAVKPQYRVANDYNLRTGERMISDKYEKIMNPTDALGQVQKEFFLAYQEIYENELLKKLPMGYRSQMLGKAPIVKGKLFQDVKNKPNIVGKLWSKATRSINNLISETAEQRGVVLDENGNLVDQLPVFYTGRVRTDEELKAINNEINALEESKKKGLIKQDDYNKQIAILKGRRLSIEARPSKGELSKDMGASLMQFSAMAEHYEVMSTVEDTFKAFIKVLEQRRYQSSNPLITLGTWSKNQFTPKAAKSALEANVVKRAKKWMAMVYYDNERVTKGFLEKVTDSLISYSSLSYVAFNPFGNFNNYALGRINNSIEALGSRFFSGSAYVRAEFEFNKRALPDLIVRLGAVAKKPFNKSDYNPEEPSSKYEALVDLFRMMDIKSEQRENQFSPEPIDKSWFKKATDFGYVLQDAAEYNVQTKIGMAILMDTMIMNKSTGDIISLYDAFEFNAETKKVSLKDGYDTIVTLDKKNVDDEGKLKVIKEVPYTNDFRYKLRNKIREVNKQIHGNYAKDDRMVIQSYVVGRLAAQFHKWVAPAIKARFRREYFDENLGWLEGRYRSFWKFLAYTGKQLTSLQLEFGKHQENFLVEYGYTGDGSQQDQRAKDKLFGAYRTLGEIGIIMMTFAISSIFNAMFSDDDDTEFENRMENFLRYQADRTYKELILFTPLGSQQIYQMFKSPIAATRTLGEFGEALSLSVMTPLAYLIKDEKEFYLDSDYVYQRGARKGELKLYKNWEDVIPILYSIKKYEDFNNLTNFYIK